MFFVKFLPVTVIACSKSAPPSARKSSPAIEEEKHETEHKIIIVIETIFSLLIFLCIKQIHIDKKKNVRSSEYF